MNYIQYMQPGGNFGRKLKSGIKKILSAAGEASRMAKDARINNPGAAMIRDAYQKGDKELAKQLTDEMQAANLTGIMIGAGAGPLATGFATAPVTTGVTLATGAAGGMGGMIATDKAIEHFSDGQYTGWGDWVNQTTNGAIGENTAHVFHPGAIVGGIAGGSVGNKAMSYVGPVADDYVVSNVKYLKDTKFKGVPEGGNIETYVPKTVKETVKTASKQTMRQLEDLGVSGLPEVSYSYENMPITGTYMGSDGTMHVGFDSKTLHNPFKYWKAYNDKSSLGINYATVAGHEPAHLVHPVQQTFLVTETQPAMYQGKPMISRGGINRTIISNENVYYNPTTGRFSPKEGTYYSTPKELLQAGLFQDINTPRQNIMKGLPNTAKSQAHLRAAMEVDADLYSLYNLGHITNGQISDEGMAFLMQRHNLSRQGVLNTINDLQSVGYANALTRQPINAAYQPKTNQVIQTSFAGESPSPSLRMSDLLPEEKILFQNLKESGYDVSKLTRDQLENISFSMSDALQGRPEGIIKSGNTYYLVNEDGITGAMQLESLENGAVAPLWVENFSKTGGNPQKGISEKLYSQAIRDNKGGLVSGGLLEDAGATLKVLEKFPNKQVRGNYGQHIFKDGAVKFDQPVYLLTSPSGSAKVPSATIDWTAVKGDVLPELLWQKQGGKLNYLNYSK